MKELLNKIVLGTVQFGLDYGINNDNGKVSSDEVKQILFMCNQYGINKLDTSYAYGDSEKILGEVGTDDFHIISKYPHIQQGVRQTFNESLLRIKKDKIYGYLIHHFDFFVEKPSIWDDLQCLKEERLVEKTGFSVYNTKELEYLFEQNIDFDIIQFPYNLFDHSFEPYLYELKQRNVEIHVRSIFLQGLFFKPLDTLPVKLCSLIPYLENLTNYCKEKAISIEELALNTAIYNQHIDNILIGVDNANQLMNNIQGVWKEYPSDIKSFVDSIEIKEKELLNPKNWN